MTTTRTAILSLFLAVSLLSTPYIAQAQVVETPATSSQIEALQQTLVALLTQLIAQLQSQINDLLAQQASQATQLGAVSSAVNTIQTQTAPVPSASLVSPVVVKTKRQNCEPSLDSARNERIDKQDVLDGYWTAARLAHSSCGVGTARSEGCQKFVSDNTPFLACMAN